MKNKIAVSLCLILVFTCVTCSKAKTQQEKAFDEYKNAHINTLFFHSEVAYIRSNQLYYIEFEKSSEFDRFVEHELPKFEEVGMLSHSMTSSSDFGLMIERNDKDIYAYHFETAPIMAAPIYKVVCESNDSTAYHAIKPEFILAISETISVEDAKQKLASVITLFKALKTLPYCVKQEETWYVVTFEVDKKRFTSAQISDAIINLCSAIFAREWASMVAPNSAGVELPWEK